MMRIEQIFEAFGIPDHEAHALAAALRFIALIDPIHLSEAISKIDRAESIGPILDPTAWLGSQKWDNAADWKGLLQKVIALQAHLPKPPLQKDPFGVPDGR